MYLCCVSQSGEAGKVLAFTLIPVHDDSEIDFEYQEVSNSYT